VIDDQTVSALETAAGCGTRLRQAREAAGLTLEDVGSRLRMPVQVVKSLEEEQWQKLGAPVFVRGQLRSYARLLNVDVSQLLEQAQVGPVVPPTLVSHTHTPRARALPRTSAGACCMSASPRCLAVPVWFATRGHFDGSATRRRAPPRWMRSRQPCQWPRPRPVSSLPRRRRGERAGQQAGSDPVRGLAGPGAALGAGAGGRGNTLDMQFSGDSWVDIGGPDGATVEKALIKSGESRSFTGPGGQVTLGNASAVQVQQNGAIVDLTPYQRANVARFQVSS
jgi:cytoskeleton protein RodZ